MFAIVFWEIFVIEIFTSYKIPMIYIEPKQCKAMVIKVALNIIIAFHINFIRTKTKKKQF